jgi:hypothetical protein
MPWTSLSETRARRYRGLRRWLHAFAQRRHAGWITAAFAMGFILLLIALVGGVS